MKMRGQTIRVGVGLVAALAACGEDDAGERGGQPGTAGLVERVLREEVVEHGPAIADAAERLLDAVVTGSAEGVSLAPLGNGLEGTVDVDLDGDGAPETPFGVSVFYPAGEPVPGAPVRLTVGRGSPGTPLRSWSGMIERGEDGTVVVEGAYASYEDDAVSLYADEGSGRLPPAPEPGQVLGTASFSAFDPDYEDRVSGTLRIEAVRVDGVRIRVQIADDPERPGDQSREFVVE